MSSLYVRRQSLMLEKLFCHVIDLGAEMRREH